MQINSHKFSNLISTGELITKSTMKFLDKAKLKILRDIFFEKKGIRYYFQTLKKDLWFAKA